MAYILKELEMTLEDMFIFTLAPVDEDKKKVVTAFIEVRHMGEREGRGWGVREEGG